MKNRYENSVGLVQPQTCTFKEPIHLVCGRQLNEYQLVYETYGSLNENRSNAILVCHALSSDHHAAGYHHEDDSKPGWWEVYIGPGKPLDTDRFYIVCANNLGGCSGSTGPTSINPETGNAYGPNFPIVTVADWVSSQKNLMEVLGISQWAAVVGGSLGGMQALQWSIDFPELLRHAIVIASAPKLSAQNIAFNEVARQAIKSDPHFHDGYYYDYHSLPQGGLSLARMLGHITYLSDDAMGSKFGRALKANGYHYGYDVEFEVESYLRYQGSRFANQFDANSYLLMTKALDYFDPAKDYGDDLAAALAQTLCRFFVLSFTSDWRFSPKRSHEIVNALLTHNKPVSYVEISAHHGHDAFLMRIPEYITVLTTYMQQVAKECQL
ncbi:MAG TPA: homoserine O-acetyltransferase [Gammaproteobacteria bacterium]|nr:homoserine O-acetyltransferase [Gammaproteobacteria bacterium]